MTGPISFLLTGNLVTMIRVGQSALQTLLLCLSCSLRAVSYFLPISAFIIGSDSNRNSSLLRPRYQTHVTGISPSCANQLAVSADSWNPSRPFNIYLFKTWKCCFPRDGRGTMARGRWQREALCQPAGDGWRVAVWSPYSLLQQQTVFSDDLEWIFSVPMDDLAASHGQHHRRRQPDRRCALKWNLLQQNGSVRWGLCQLSEQQASDPSCLSHWGRLSQPQSRGTTPVHLMLPICGPAGPRTLHSLPNASDIGCQLFAWFIRQLLWLDSSCFLVAAEISFWLFNPQRLPHADSQKCGQKFFPDLEAPLPGSLLSRLALMFAIAALAQKDCWSSPSYLVAFSQAKSSEDAVLLSQVPSGVSCFCPFSSVPSGGCFLIVSLLWLLPVGGLALSFSGNGTPGPDFKISVSQLPAFFVYKLGTWLDRGLSCSKTRLRLISVLSLDLPPASCGHV